MTARLTIRSHLRALIDEVSGALEHNALDRSRRARAREALLHAWVVLNAPPRSVSQGRLRRWARRLDALLAPDPAEAPLWPLIDHVTRHLDLPRFPLVDHLEDLARSAHALARRTEDMVEQAERTARRLGRGVSDSSETPSGEREPLELVWGEEE